MKNRTEKELLELLLKIYKNSIFINVLRYGIDGLFLKNSGLCNAITRLYTHRTINLQEDVTLWKHIHKNRPKSSTDVYWWPKGHTKPRIKFLEKLISKL